MLLLHKFFILLLDDVPTLCTLRQATLARTIATTKKCEFCKTCMVLARTMDPELIKQDHPPEESNGNEDREDMLQLPDMADRGRTCGTS